MGPVHVAGLEKKIYPAPAQNNSTITLPSISSLLAYTPNLVTLGFRSAEGNGSPGAVSTKSVCWVRCWRVPWQAPTFMHRYLG